MRRAILIGVAVALLVGAGMASYLIYDRYDSLADEMIAPPKRGVNLYAQDREDAQYEQAMLEYQQALDAQETDRKLWLTLLIVAGGGLTLLSIVFLAAGLFAKDNADIQL